MPIPERGLRTTLSIPGFPPIGVKLLKPRNGVELMESGARDFGFAGIDLLKELGSTVLPYFDTQLDPVRIVLAAPVASCDDAPVGSIVPRKIKFDRHITIATEYRGITNDWILKTGMNASVRLSHGSTEVFPPEDADAIIDNTSTGTTLRENGMEILQTIFRSSTHLCVNPHISKEKLMLVDRIVLLFGSVLTARKQVLVDFNVQEKNLATCCKIAPGIDKPTISPCYDKDAKEGEKLFAVRVVAPKGTVPEMIVALKANGASGILVSKLNCVVA